MYALKIHTHDTPMPRKTTLQPVHYIGEIALPGVLLVFRSQNAALHLIASAKLDAIHDGLLVKVLYGNDRHSRSPRVMKTHYSTSRSFCFRETRRPELPSSLNATQITTSRFAEPVRKTKVENIL